MSKTLSYGGGSVIYFQGDTADRIFIVQKGTVRVTNQNIETGNDEHETLQPGEFFGVKSTLGRYNREENAIALQNSVIMSLSVGEFEQLAMANTRIVMKMLKVFSNHLRRIHRQVTSLMVKEEQQGPEDGLFRVGKYYLKNKRYAHARYVFNSYLTYYQEGKNAAEAARGLEKAETMLSGKSGSQPAAADEQLPAESPPPPPNTAKAYYDALSLIAQKKYSQAYAALQKIIESDDDPEYAVKSGFDIGRCLFFMGKYDDCIRHLSRLISNHPSHQELGTALFFIGQSHEQAGSPDKAAEFYKKTLAIAPGEEELCLKVKRALQDMEA